MNIFFTGHHASSRLLGGTGPVKDYSIIVPENATRDQIYSRILEIAGLTSIDRSVTQLKQTLRHHLRKNHPIQSEIRRIAYVQLKKLYNELCPSGKRREERRIQTSLVTYFFKEYPQGPLTALQEALQGNFTDLFFLYQQKLVKSICGDRPILDIFFHQIKLFIRHPLAFVFGLQAL